jgi:AraC-like DNA-binding protein
MVRSNRRGKERPEPPEADPNPRIDVLTDIAGLRVFEAFFPPLGRMEEHCHAHARLGFLLQGRASEVTADAEMLVHANTLSFHPAKLPHTNVAGSDGARMLLIEVTDGRAADLIPSLGDIGREYVGTFHELRSGAIDLSRELRAKDPARTASIEGLALDFLARASELVERSLETGPPKPPIPTWLERMKVLVDLHLDEPLTPRAVADALQLSERDLTSAMRRHLHMTFGAYLHHRRVQRAMALLRETDLSIADIALGAGFYDQPHLSHVLQNEIGVTPAQYREMHRRRS